MSDNDFIFDTFCRFKMRKHDQEIQNYHVDENDDGENDESIDCLNTEKMLRNLGELDIPTFDDIANIRTSQSNVCFPMSTNLRSISINKSTRKKHQIGRAHV